MTAGHGVTFNNPTWSEPVEYRYVVSNRAEEEVGEATCRITPGEAAILLECSHSIEQYEVRTGSSFFSEASHTQDWSATWDARSLELVAFDLERFDEDGKTSLTAALDGQTLTVNGEDLAMTAELGEDVLLGYEWPWRMMFLKGDAGFASTVSSGFLLTWDEDA